MQDIEGLESKHNLHQVVRGIHSVLLQQARQHLDLLGFLAQTRHELVHLLLKLLPLSQQ